MDEWILTPNGIRELAKEFADGGINGAANALNDCATRLATLEGEVREKDSELVLLRALRITASVFVASNDYEDRFADMQRALNAYSRSRMPTPTEEPPTVQCTCMTNQLGPDYCPVHQA